MADPIAPAASPGPITPAAALGLPSLPREAQPGANFAPTTRASRKPLPGSTEPQKAAATPVEETQPDYLAPMSLEEAAAAMREYIDNLPSNLEFRKDESSGYTVFKVSNPVTGEVIREYPPKEILEMARRLRASTDGDGAGVLIDQQS